MKLDDYNESFELIQNIIKYEKNKQKKFIFFKKNFWDSYYIYCINNEEEKNKIPKLVGIYNLLLSYIDLGKDDSEYKEILAGKIHELILKKLEEIPVAKINWNFYSIMILIIHLLVMKEIQKYLKK